MKNILLIISLAITIHLSAQNQLQIPDTLSGTSFQLNLQNGSVNFYEGQETTTMGVNGNILGPTLIMNKNDFVDIRVNNNIGETTTIHWHGMHVSAANDGGPHTTIAPGENWNPKFTVLDKAGTYWYHPHLHEFTNKHVSLGIAGFILVKDNEEAALNLPRTYGVDDFPLVIQTKDFDESNQIIVPSNSDDIPMVNATINPFLEVPAQMVRFRLLNGSSQRVFNLGLTGNQIFYQIGSDGGLLNKPVALTRLQMAPGERAEIVINFSEINGNSIQLMSYASELSNGIYGAAYPGMGFMMTLNGYNPNPLNGNDFQLIDFRVINPTANPVLSIPEKLVDVKRLSENEASTNRNLSFNPTQMGPNQLNGDFLINGQHFDMDVINFSIPLNNIEVWSLTNQSGIAHPFHIHDVQFYVLDRNGITPPLNEQGRKDVVLVNPMETVRFITQFTDFANDSVPYMLHCHMLTHEDKGMMLQFEVVDQTTGIQQMVINNDVVKFYPNPLSSKNSILSVSGIKSELVKYELYDLLGQLWNKGEESIKNNSFQIDVSGIKPGAYLIKIWADNSTYQQKIVVK
ncbi:multicopper oxidase domain-containing protein [uncultured Draconibacterium sp.]|uniref:multicopper oxidase domain-containing protein n=1 Tax=uncultured Draconibacterium sp. TaxID=1573823 RepID=UPI003216829D